MTVQVRCIKPFGFAKAGDVADVPDDALVDPVHWELVTVPADPPAAVAAVAPRLPYPVKEM